jgi:hypothetical protein
VFFCFYLVKIKQANKVYKAIPTYGYGLMHIPAGFSFFCIFAFLASYLVFRLRLNIRLNMSCFFSFASLRRRLFISGYATPSLRSKAEYTGGVAKQLCGPSLRSKAEYTGGVAQQLCRPSLRSKAEYTGGVAQQRSKNAFAEMLI